MTEEDRKTIQAILAKLIEMGYSKAEIVEAYESIVPPAKP